MEIKYKIDIAELADHYVVAAKDKETGEPVEVFTLNESGVDMLKLFMEGNEAEVVAQRMAELYGAPLELITRDVQTFIGNLKQKGIV
ncbi:MAG: PqqD family protein [Bacteroidaceae bacterium]|nr:PqqD family protein [Bacteroidaceae bacterium]